MMIFSKPHHNCRWLFFVVLAFFLLNVAPAVYAKSFFWKAQSPTAIVYLLGSIHFAKPDLYPLDPTIEQAFEQASFLVVELDETKIDKEDMRRRILAKGMYEAPDSVESHISESTLKLLEDYLDRYDMPLRGYNRMKPGFLAMTLSIGHVIRMGYLPENGIDMYFQKKAKDKTVLQLENYTDQLDLFFNMPDEELFLKRTLLEFEDFDSQIDETMTAWKTGDTRQMEENVLVKPLKEAPELRQVYDKIYTARNIKMADKIMDFLRQNDTYFVVVGAGHLIGEQGIVNLLKRQGFKVTQY